MSNAGRTMAYIDEGEGDAIVFQLGNPTSSYPWRTTTTPTANVAIRPGSAWRCAVRTAFGGPMAITG